jgi:hypothetical protein
MTTFVCQPLGFLLGVGVCVLPAAMSSSEHIIFLRGACGLFFIEDEKSEKNPSEVKKLTWLTTVARGELTSFDLN